MQLRAISTMVADLGLSMDYRSTRMGGCVYQLLITGLLSIYIPAAESTEADLVHDICLMERFEARCPDEHVVMMQRALYGRMRNGRCVSVDSGSLGCVADVGRYFDGLCSGRQECAIKVPNDHLFDLNVCHQGHLTYLEAAYTCVPVLSGRHISQACRDDGVVTLSGRPEGVIASSVVFSQHLGSPICPWVLEGLPGQRINVTLVDFGQEEGGTTGSEGYYATCHKYAVIREDAVSSPTTVCSGSQRERNIYVSKAHRLEIQFVDMREVNPRSHFLFKYAVYGCPEPALDGNVLTERTTEKAVLLCESSGLTRNLYCHGAQWNGQVEKCLVRTGSNDNDWLSTQGVAIIIVIGLVLGTLIGLAFLLCAYHCIKRRQQHSTPRLSLYYEGDTLPKGDKLEAKELSLMQGDYPTYGRRGVSDARYAHVWSPVNRDVIVMESRELPSVSMTDQVIDIKAPQVQQQREDKLHHIYERPL